MAWKKEVKSSETSVKKYMIIEKLKDLTALPKRIRIIKQIHHTVINYCSRFMVFMIWCLKDHDNILQGSKNCLKISAIWQFKQNVFIIQALN